MATTKKSTVKQKPLKKLTGAHVAKWKPVMISSENPYAINTALCWAVGCLESHVNGEYRRDQFNTLKRLSKLYSKVLDND